MGGACQSENVTQNGLSFIPAKPASQVENLMTVGHAWRVMNGLPGSEKKTRSEHDRDTRLVLFEDGSRGTKSLV